jgi:hypothetical protein
MRVLVVSAYRGSNQRQGEQFLRQVRAALASMAGLLGGPVELLPRSFSQLSEFVPAAPVPEAPADEAVVRALNTFDSIDMIFLDGDDNLAPWSRQSAQLLRLFQLCVASGKPLLGCGCAASMLAYLASIGPVPIPVRLGTLSNFEPPSDGSARLDKRTGDLSAGSKWRYQTRALPNQIRALCNKHGHFPIKYGRSRSTAQQLVQNCAHPPGGHRPVAHPGLLGGKARPCATRSAQPWQGGCLPSPQPARPNPLST